MTETRFTERIEQPFPMLPRNIPRVGKIKQLKIDENTIANVKRFAELTARTEALAYETLVERGLIAMGATPPPLPDETA